MSFVRIGKWIINLSMITCIEIYDSGGIKVNMSGSEDLRMDSPEGQTLVALLNVQETKTSSPR